MSRASSRWWFPVAAAVALFALVFVLLDRGEDAPVEVPTAIVDARVDEPTAEQPAPAPAPLPEETEPARSERVDETKPPAPKPPVEPPWWARVRGRVVALDGDLSGTLVCVAVPSEGREEHALPGVDGYFELEVRGKGSALLDARRDGEVLSPPVDIGSPIRRASANVPEGEPAVVDVYELWIGRALSMRIRAIDSATGEAVHPFAAYLVPEAQAMGCRGVHPQARSGYGGALAVGYIEPQVLGVATGDAPLEVRIPETLCGSTLVVATEAGLGSIRLGASGCLREGARLDVPVPPWCEYEVEVRGGGEPAPGAEVFLQGSHESSVLVALVDDPPFEVAGTFRVTCDESGLARFRSVPPAPGLRIAAKHPELGSGMILAHDAPKERQVIELRAPWAARGGERVVFVDVDDRPIARVSARVNGVEMPVDEHGVLVLPAGFTSRSGPVLEAEHPGYVALRRVVRPKPSEELQLVLHSAAPLTVTVIDEEGAPVPEVEVQLVVPHEERPKVTHAFTSSAGLVLFPETPRDGDRRLMVHPPSPVQEWCRLDPARSPALRGIAPGETSVTVELRRSGIPLRSLTVEAVDRVSGELLPIDNLRFSVLSDAGGGPRRWTPRGVFLGNERARVESVQDGRYLVWVLCVGGESGVVAFEVEGPDQRVTCPVGGKRTLSGCLTSADPAVSVAGFLVGAGIAGVEGPNLQGPDRRLWSGLVQAQCDAEGRFELEGLIRAVYELRCLRPRGGESLLVDLTGELPDSLELVWTPGNCLLVDVVSPVEPDVDRLRVRWRDPAAGPSWHEQLLGGRSDEPILLHVTPGRVEVVLEAGSEAGDFVELGRTTVTVAEGETVTVRM